MNKIIKRSVVELLVVVPYYIMVLLTFPRFNYHTFSKRKINSNELINPESTLNDKANRFEMILNLCL